MNSIVLPWLFILHFIADFLLQSRQIATKKSENFRYLSEHCLILLFTFVLGIGWISNGVLLSLTNMIVHGIIDWNIWRVYKKGKSWDFEYWKDATFYTIIGLDQLLHGLTLIVLNKLFIQ